MIPVVASNIPLGTLIAERPEGARPFTRDERLLLEAATRKRPSRWTARGSTRGRARAAGRRDEPAPCRDVLPCPVTHDLRTPLASIKAGVTSLLGPDRPLRGGAGTRAAHDDPRGDRPLNRSVGNNPRLAQDPSGGLDPEARADGRRRGRGSGRGPDAPPCRLHGRAPTRRRPSGGRGGPRAARPGTHQPAGERRSAFAERRDDPDPRLSETRDAVRVRVADEGPGIKPEEREKVFEAFYRVRESPESSGSGLGLGDRHRHGPRRTHPDRGDDGGGTAVVVDVPLEETLLLKGCWWSMTSRRSGEPSGRASRRMRLRGRRPSGREERGGRRPTKGARDLALLDLGRPDMDGTEVILRVRGLRCSVIICRSARHSRDKVAALDAGADDYVIKSFAMEELLAGCARCSAARPAQPP